METSEMNCGDPNCNGLCGVLATSRAEIFPVILAVTGAAVPQAATLLGWNSVCYCDKCIGTVETLTPGGVKNIITFNLLIPYSAYLVLQKGAAMLQLLQRLKSDERGISAIEYAILAGVLVVAIVTLVMTFGGEIGELFGRATTSLEAAKEGVDVTPAD